MYCSHCGYNLSKRKIKKAEANANFRSFEAKEAFGCPRCGHVIKPDLNEEETKALARASHAEVHRSRNLVNGGLCFLVIGIILAVISFMFFLMSFKAADGGKFSTTCTEFYVFICVGVISVSLLVLSVIYLIRGIRKNKEYSLLLRDIQNGVFNQ